MGVALYMNFNFFFYEKKSFVITFVLIIEFQFFLGSLNFHLKTMRKAFKMNEVCGRGINVLSTNKDTFVQTHTPN